MSEFGTRLLTAASQITQNSADAEDLVFRTFTQVIAKIGQYDGRSAFFTWVYRVLINYRRMDLRKKGANALVFMEQLPEREDPTPDPRVVIVYSTGDCRIVHRLPDVMTTVFDPYDRSDELGFADPAIADDGFLKTKTYSAPWTVQGLSFLSSGSVWYREKLPTLPEAPVGLLNGVSPVAAQRQGLDSISN